MHIDRGSLCFSLFGIPIVITPFSWVILAVLGGGLDMSDAGDLGGILVFVAVGMVTLLVHELGHALVGRALGGEAHGIVVQGLGAVTYSSPPAGKWRHFLMVLAGPLATLIPALAAGILFGLQICGNPLPGIWVSLAVPLNIPLPTFVTSLLQEGGVHLSPFAAALYFTVFSVSVWWSLFNLLPILPMDGGHLLSLLCPHRRVVCVVGLVFAAGIGVWSLCNGYIFMLMLFGYFAYINIRAMKMDH